MSGSSAGSAGARRRAAARRAKPGARPGKRLLAHDRREGARYVAGVDEAGRGCLAGPLVASAVVLDLARLVGPEAAALGRLDDSKKLLPALREQLYRVVMSRACAVSTVAISARTIDRDGLHRCNIAAMRRALGALAVRPDVVLVDGFALEPVEIAGQVAEPRRIVRGDGTSAAIAAAAIVAKVTRDRHMARLCEETGGQWAFAEHVGYATELHAERIREHGVSIHHRRSYDATSYLGAPDAVLAFPG